MPEKQMVGRAGFEQLSRDNGLGQGAGVSGAFDAKELFREPPAPDPAHGAAQPDGAVFADGSKPIKPLGGKAYGSIGHLPQSRVGPGDWHVHEGQARICLEKPRKGDRIIVCEKLDGACMSVANIGGEIVALTRAGYRADQGTYEHLRAFAPWVGEHEAVFARLLKPGERVAGEWLALAHGTIYSPSSSLFRPFVAFDIIRGKDRVLRDEFRDRCESVGLTTAECVYDGPLGCSIEEALGRLGPYGRHGSVDPIEGAVWRVEREGRVDFLAKFVRADKQDGKYLPNLSGGESYWHIPSPLPPMGTESGGRSS